METIELLINKSNKNECLEVNEFQKSRDYGQLWS